MSIIEEALGVLKTREFVAMATADKGGKPNCAPKLLLKIIDGVVYFIDYSMGKTAENLKANPAVSLSFIDINSLFGYVLNGTVDIIEQGLVYDQCLGELREKKIKLSVERIVQGIHDGKPHKAFELEFPERFLVYKVIIAEGAGISPRGEIKR
ncbi:MAG: pyridoxamine 5'-phosphate oxidase family protein [Candidatus Omnitrophota bacterium]